MEILKNIDAARKYIKELKKEGKTIGLVPTMGYFHEGHLELMRRSIEKNHETIVSLFVNPTQFGPNEDLDRYPKDLERDFKLAEEIGVKAIFLPTTSEMYPDGYKTYVTVEDLSNVLCGEYRPGHFRGVATVVLKLFNIITPDEAFFGQKDGQQVIIIKKMVEDLNLDIPIEIVPTVREKDGLAMSSRNAYLNEKERQAAPILYKTLKMVEEMVAKGERNSSKIIKAAEEMVATEPLANLQYIDIRSIDDLSTMEELHGEVMVAMAVIIGSARLIDNIILKV